MSEVEIRPAAEPDFNFVAGLMNDALSPFYGGDHIEHAKRIFSTHIQGGIDRIGFFSLEQKMFIASLAGERIGLVHVVRKRQSNVKISPLIVHPEYRKGMGVGRALLSRAESYAQELGSRQIYCTVAEGNTSALAFFKANGYNIAGRSASHYLVGSTEYMLYKPLEADDRVVAFDRDHISVLPLLDKHRDQVSELLLASLPKHFAGIDSDWVDRLFSGYDRRDQREINLKYKLIYTATDRADHVRGVAAATPKKGEPIKIMPLVAEDEASFFALLSDMPQFLSEYGRKVYAHITPSSNETRFLQRSGWTLEGVMPDAYQPGQVTQQWGLEINEANLMRTMRLKQRFLNAIREGEKPLEVRVRYDNLKNISRGERIRFVSQADQLITTVKDVRTYDGFTSMLANEDYRKIVPGAPLSEVEKLLREIYPPEKERLGVMVIELAA